MEDTVEPSVFVPGIISLVIMCIGIIWNNSFFSTRTRPGRGSNRSSATANVTLYCTWRPSVLHTGPHGQVLKKRGVYGYIYPQKISPWKLFCALIAADDVRLLVFMGLKHCAVKIYSPKTNFWLPLCTLNSFPQMICIGLDLRHRTYYVVVIRSHTGMVVRECCKGDD